MAFRHSGLILSICLMAVGTIAKPAFAEEASGFTGSQLMSWSSENRHAYLDNAIGMMASIFAQDAGGYAPCIGDWYFKDDVSQRAARAEIEAVLERFGEFDPRGAIIALVRQKCGPMPLQNGN